MTLPHEPRAGTLLVGKFYVALSRDGAGFLKRLHSGGTVWTPDLRDALRFLDRKHFAAFSEALATKRFKLIVCHQEIRVGPKPKVPKARPAASGPPEARTDRTRAGARKKAGAPVDAGAPETLV